MIEAILLSLVTLHLLLFNRNTFRQNLVSGDKSVVFPILQWLLEKLPEHKERSYLGRYLSKIDMPSEFLSDPEIAEQHERVGYRRRNSVEIASPFGFSTMN